MRVEGKAAKWEWEWELEFKYHEYGVGDGDDIPRGEVWGYK